MTSAGTGHLVTALWHEAADSLTFIPRDHAAACFVHRRAFRVLIGHLPEPDECLAWFEARQPAFVAAATEKLARRPVERHCAFHINSRDIRRHLNGSAHSL